MSFEVLATYKYPGKIFLAGEYSVLRGNTALLLPTTYHHSYQFMANHKNRYEVISRDRDGIFFQSEASKLDDESQMKNFLQFFIELMKHQFAHANHGVSLQVHLDFPRSFGLGSSGGLVLALCEFTGLCPYELLAKTFGGSGADIALMQHFPKGVKYQRNKNVETFVPHYPFHHNLYFIHLGNKASSELAVKRFSQCVHRFLPKAYDLEEVVQQLAVEKNYTTFCELLAQHEAILGEVLEETPIQQGHFSDFSGTIKQLGAWGGDFILAASTLPERYINHYFQQKGCSLIFKWEQFIHAANR